MSQCHTVLSLNISVFGVNILNWDQFKFLLINPYHYFKFSAKYKFEYVTSWINWLNYYKLNTIDFTHATLHFNPSEMTKPNQSPCHN